MSVQTSSPPQQAVVVLGGTFMWQVRAQASEDVIKLIKKKNQKSPKGAAKVQQVLPRDASSTGNPFENKPNPQFHGFSALMNPQNALKPLQEHTPRPC